MLKRKAVQVVVGLALAIALVGGAGVAADMLGIMDAPTVQAGTEVGGNCF